MINIFREVNFSMVQKKISIIDGPAAAGKVL